MKKNAFYFFLVLAILAFLPTYALAGSATLNWQSYGESDLAGYRVYYGNEPRIYGPPLNVDTTNCNLNNLSVGMTYYFAVTAFDTSGNESGFSNEVQKTVTDETNPVVSLSTPTSEGSYLADSDTLLVTGTATDNIQVSRVMWENSLGGSGTASGTSSWSVSGITLAEGTNNLTFTAEDAAGNRGSRSLAVTYNAPSTAAVDTVPPSVQIVSPTTKTNYFTNEVSVDLAGTAADNGLLQSITWQTSNGESGTAAGIQQWAVTGIPLNERTSNITVTAHDAAGNSSTASLRVFCRSLK
jgi:hypothetical protein